MRQRAVPAVVWAALVGLVATSCREPTAPTAESGSDPLRPSFSFTGGSGTLIGTTDAGELVRVDLDSAKVTLIGSAGVEWTGLALADPDTLWVTGRPASGGTHLYKVDAGTGAVLEDLGAVNLTRVEDLAFANDTILVNACCSRIFGYIDPTIPDLIWKSPVNAFIDPINGSLMEPGGLAVHPATGEVWGVEIAHTQPRNIYRIDVTTGYPDSIIRVGFNGAEATFGFDGLHILPDGTFLATRGRGTVPADSVLYEVSPVRDPVSGLAEVALIPLTFDTLIAGKLNGLEADPGAITAIELTADVTELHPWIPELTVNRRLQDSIAGGVASLSVSATVGGVPANVNVDVWAEFLDNTGGHAHQTARIRHDDIPLATDSFPALRPFFYGLVGNPWTGFFQYSSAEHASFQATTASGQLDFAFQAGAIGGEVDLIAQMEVQGVPYADTVRVQIRVPGLIDGRTTGGVTGVYWVGGTTTHPQGSNWFMTPEVAAAMQVIVDSMAVLDAGTGFYLQHNDASLPSGGAFTGHPDSLLVIPGSTETIDNPRKSHTSHALGIDVDLGWCYTTTTEYHSTWPQPARELGTVCSATKAVDDLVLTWIARQYGGCTRVHSGNHYHIRFAGPCPEGVGQ